VAGYVFQDAGVVVRPHATQSLDCYYHRHAALSVEFHDAGVSRWFFVGPTFCQFSSDDAVPQPGAYLGQAIEGNNLLEELLEHGLRRETNEGI